MPPEIQEDKPVDVSWRPFAGVVVLILALFILTAVVVTLAARGLDADGIRLLIANGFIIYSFASFGLKWIRNETLK